MKTLVKCLALAVLIATVVIACSKDNSSTNPAVPGCLLTSVKLDTMETTLQFDASGRIVKATDIDSTWPHWSASFEYSQGKVIERDSAASANSHVIDMASVKIIHLLGANGYASVSYFENVDFVGDTTYYTYDNDGYMTSSTHVHYQSNTIGGTLLWNYTEKHTYAIQNGNRTSEVNSWLDKVNGERKTTAQYTYYNGQSNVNGMNFNYYYDYPFMGKRNESLVKRVTSVYDVVRTSASDYVYDFDTDGKPVKANVTTVDDSGTFHTTYSLKYQCQ